ncbi:hypothetical protein yc1106_00276 [Curvularia clavata]|uniref:Peptidase A1 domain-containing protein n=1 Tax=Curvularia clavata TaxID=95742 RepID=A0A9Q8YZE5_CURCL|nr:hypothetical protein yc1106_00276 [Curvularia clavata]
MFNNLLLLSLPILSCHATYLDPSLQQQRPLAPGSLPIIPSDTTVLPLSLNEDLSYTFPSPNPHRHHHHATPLHRLQSTSAIHATHHSHSTITVSIPLSVSQPATVSFSPASSNPPATRLTWVPQDPWDAAMRHMPLLDAGIRKGGMLSMDAEAAVLDLGTPFIAVPKGLWDVVVLATAPVKATVAEDEGVLRVDCGAMGRFPDLVLGVLVDEEDEEAKEEFVVTPEQYVLQRGDECLLLVREAKEGSEHDVELGWAAVRGRDVVFDWEGGRMGFGELKG